MKIGDMEIPDAAIEDVIKKSGKRIVESDDYEKKAAAAADLAKFRKVTGDERSIDEIDKIIKAYEESEKKNKTQAELALAEAKRLEKEWKTAQGEVKKLQMEVRKRDVTEYFNQAQAATGIKIIEPILESFRKPFYEMEDGSVTPEQLKEQVAQALSKAADIQKGELLKLGLQGIAPENAASFSGGSMKMNVAASPGVEIGGPQDLFNIMRQTSATPMGVPLAVPKPNPK